MECLGINGQHAHLKDCDGTTTSVCREYARKAHADSDRIRHPWRQWKYKREQQIAKEEGRLPFHHIKGNKWSDVGNPTELNERLEREWKEHLKEIEKTPDVPKPVAPRLTPELRALGVIHGFFPQPSDDSSALPKGAESFLAPYRRKRQPQEDDGVPYLTDVEMIIKIAKQDGLCYACLKPLRGFHSGRGNEVFPHEVEALHIPSLAAAKEHGISLTKENVYPGHKTCNRVMEDNFGLMSIEEIRPILIKELEYRGIKFYGPEQVETFEKTKNAYRPIGA